MSMASNFFALYAVRPLIRREVPGWGKLYTWFVGGHRSNDRWAKAGVRTLRDKRYGLERRADLGQWADRKLYFLGRWYDLPTQIVADRLLSPGDTAIDVGANYGHFSMAAAARVGPSGCVLAFEPNPHAFERLSLHLERNGLTQVCARQMGLAAAPAQMVLTVPRINCGEASFAGSLSDAVDTIDCPVARLDDMAGDMSPALLKIDVEGFEAEVLAGAEELLKRARPVIVLEMVKAHLGRAGTTPAALSEQLSRAGYRSYRMGLVRRRFGHALSLTAVSPETKNGNYLWLPEERAETLLAQLDGAV